MTRIPPKTDLTVSFKLTDSSDAFVNTATVTASVYDSKGRTVVTDQAMTPQGSGGLYDLAWDKTWTVYNSRVVLGEYVVEVTATNAGVTRTDRFRLPVVWGDTT